VFKESLEDLIAYEIMEKCAARKRSVSL